MKRKLLTARLCSSLLMPGTVVPVIAQEAGTELQSEATIVHSGKIGTADWTIDSNGVLTIGEGEFTNDDYNYVFPWIDYLDTVTRVDGTANFKLEGYAKMAFSKGNYQRLNTSIISIDLSGWDTSTITNTHRMFNYCTSLTKLNLSGWNTSSITEIDWMFMGCSSLTELNLNSWDTSSVTNMNCMFSDCSSLTDLNLSGWDTSSVKDMNEVFYGCRTLSELNINRWDTSSAKGMNYMFSDCSSLTELNLSNWDTSSVTSMYDMFSDCTKLTKLNLSGWDTSSVSDMDSMFKGCTSLTDLNISGWDTSSVYITKDIFKNSPALSQIYYSQKAAKILSKLPEQTGWYQNQQGPYDISNLPELAEGQIALLARDPSVAPNLGGDDSGPSNTDPFKIDEDFFSFKNFGSTSKKYWETWYTQQEAEWINKFAQKGSGGQCYGFSMAAALFRGGLYNPNEFSDNSGNHRDSVFKLEKKDTLDDTTLSTVELIRYCFPMQVSIDADRTWTTEYDPRSKKLTEKDCLNLLAGAVKSLDSSDTAGILLGIQGKQFGLFNGWHSVYAYGYEETQSELKIKIADSNNPGKIKYITIEKDLLGDYINWKYEDHGLLGWKFEDLGFKFTFIDKSKIKEISKWFNTNNIPLGNQNSKSGSRTVSQTKALDLPTLAAFESGSIADINDYREINIASILDSADYQSSNSIYAVYDNTFEIVQKENQSGPLKYDVLTSEGAWKVNAPENTTSSTVNVTNNNITVDAPVGSTASFTYTIQSEDGIFMDTVISGKMVDSTCGVTISDSNQNPETVGFEQVIIEQFSYAPDQKDQLELLIEKATEIISRASEYDPNDISKLENYKNDAIQIMEDSNNPEQVNIAKDSLHQAILKIRKKPEKSLLNYTD